MSGRDALAGLDGYLMILYGDCPLLRVETLRRLIDSATSGDGAGVLLTRDDGRSHRATGVSSATRTAVCRGLWSRRPGTPEQLAIREANMGIYCYRADLFWKHVDEIRPDNPANEYYLTDMAEILNRAGHHVEAMQIDDAREALGINTRLELAEVDRLFRERKAARADAGRRDDREAGDGDDRCGRADRDGHDRRGRSRRSAGARSSARTAGSEAAPIVRGLRNRRRGRRSGRSRSWARRGWSGACTPGRSRGCAWRITSAQGAHIGNFVELKKTRMGAGAKASHLAYLGDSQIGAKVNIGAGTITCNYDGFKKHQTQIGDGAFVGQQFDAGGADRYRRRARMSGRGR